MLRFYDLPVTRAISFRSVTRISQVRCQVTLTFRKVLMKKTITLICFSLAAVSSQAVVTFNTFGPGDTTKSFGWGFGDIRDARIASQFTPTVSGTFESLTMKLLPSTTPANATISLFEDAGNDIGLLKTSFVSLIGPGGLTVFTNSNPSIQLTAGNKYWIEAKTTAAGSNLYSGWSVNNQGIRGITKFGAVLGSFSNPTSTYTVGSNAELPAFRVTVAPVPEPSTLAAMGLFTAFTAMRRRKAK